MSGEEDAAGFEMQVHQVEGNATLEVTIDAVQNNLTPDIDYLEIREVGLGNRLVNSLVFSYAAKEVEFGLFWKSVRVVWVPGTDFKRNIRGDDNGVIARRFNEHSYYSPLASHPRFNGSSGHTSTSQKLAPLRCQALTYGSACYS